MGEICTSSYSFQYFPSREREDCKGRSFSPCVASLKSMIQPRHLAGTLRVRPRASEDPESRGRLPDVAWRAGGATGAGGRSRERGRRMGIFRPPAHRGVGPPEGHVLTHPFSFPASRCSLPSTPSSRAGGGRKRPLETQRSRVGGEVQLNVFEE